METDLKAEAEGHPVVAAGIDHGSAIGDRGGHGLLDQDVLTSGSGTDHLGRMQVVGRGDEHRLDTRVGEQRVQRVIPGIGPVFFSEPVGAVPGRGCRRPPIGSHPHDSWPGQFSGRRGTRVQ